VNASNFLAELKRRNVYKVAVAYAVVSWLPHFRSRHRSFRFSESRTGPPTRVLLVVIGFPIALMIAWAFESTPEGISERAVADAAREHSRGKAWIYIVHPRCASVDRFVFLGRYTAGNATPRHDASPARAEATTATPQKSIVVLPLLNESGDSATNIFPMGCRRN